MGSKVREGMKDDSKISNQSDWEDVGKVDKTIKEQGPRLDRKTLNG